MSTQFKQRCSRPSVYYLKCDKCGNNRKFIEVMKYESHVVDGNVNYVGLGSAETDYYKCAECDANVSLRSREVGS